MWRLPRAVYPPFPKSPSLDAALIGRETGKMVCIATARAAVVSWKLGGWLELRQNVSSCARDGLCWLGCIDCCLHACASRARRVSDASIASVSTPSSFQRCAPATSTLLPRVIKKFAARGKASGRAAVYLPSAERRVKCLMLLVS
jgi:hypothetical protein